MMRRIYIYMILAAAAAVMCGCAVHQWPAEEEPAAAEEADLILQLNFHTDMTMWEHYYDIDTNTTTEITTDSPVTYDNTQAAGFIRYIIRIYPLSEVRSAAMWHLQEYIFTREFTGGDYNFETEISLPCGEYTILAWADIRTSEQEEPIYNAEDFAQVELTEHRICSDYRDAFRGIENMTLESAEEVGTVCVEMHRPLAKFEIVAEGMEDFIRTNPMRSLSDYRVIMAYTGYTPYAYSAVSDMLVDSRYNERFETGFTVIDEASASMGFDYFMVKAEPTSTRVQIGVFDAAGEEIAMSEPFIVPLQRDRHTVIRGKFMAARASDGMVGLDPGFDGDFNIVQ